VTEDSLFSRFDHVAVIVKDLDKAIEYYQTLGMGHFEKADLSGLTDKTMYGKPVDFQTEMAHAQVGGVTFELIQPVKDAPVFEEFMEENGEGINHIAFVVDDLEKETAKLVEKGAEVILTAKMPGGGGGVYLDTRKVGGVLIELVQW